MSSPVNIKVIYNDGISLTLKGKAFKEAIQIAFDYVYSKNDEPLKVKLLSTNKILYADKNTFMAYLQDSISLEDLIQFTQCDDVYRNGQEIICLGTPLEPNQLWKKIGNRIFLIDDDNTIDIPFEEDYFIRVE